ncbi:MAG: VOC family protein [Actinomyces sp.]|nr:MAG: VOC family protein [Actinomyces sp.]
MSGPPEPRLTHLALVVRDLEATIAWYEAWTPLRVGHRRRDPDGAVAWLGHPDPGPHPFVLVFIEQDRPDHDPVPLGPLAHLGIEMPSREEVDAVARRAREAGILHWEPADIGPPVGYICAVTDPDGNVVEFSHDQGLYDAVTGASPPA